MDGAPDPRDVEEQEPPMTECDVCGDEMPDYSHGPHVCSTECREQLNEWRGERR